MKRKLFKFFLPVSSGITLVEVLLYVALTSFILVFISVSLSVTLQARVKNQTISDVDQEGNQAMLAITQSIRNALTVNSPATSTSASLVSLRTSDSASDPTIFDMSSGVLRIKEGAGSVIALTSPRVSVSQLTFSNLSRPGTSGVIEIQFTLTHINTAGKSEYDYTKHFTTSASLRP